MCDRLPQSLEVDIKMQEKENEEEEEDSKDGSRSKGGPKNKKKRSVREKIPESVPEVARSKREESGMSRRGGVCLVSGRIGQVVSRELTQREQERNSGSKPPGFRIPAW